MQKIRIEHIIWNMWEPNPEMHASKDPFYRTDIGSVPAFLKLLEYWRSQHPGKLTLVTLTTVPYQGGYQLRLWFGEPHNVRRDFVDSCGNNLLVHMFDGPRYNLQQVVREIIKDGGFKSDRENDVDVWRFVQP